MAIVSSIPYFFKSFNIALLTLRFLNYWFNVTDSETDDRFHSCEHNSTAVFISLRLSNKSIFRAYDGDELFVIKKNLVSCYFSFAGW